MWPNLANAAGFQMVWLCCVGGAGAGQAWLGPVAALLFAMAVLALGGKARADLRALAVALPLGFAFDSAFAASGWLQYAQPWPWASAAPVWIWALWAGFALTLNHSMAWFRQHPWLAALFGFVGGPLAYATAARGFRAIEFDAADGVVLVALALAWALVLPLLLWIDGRLLARAQRWRPA